MADIGIEVGQKMRSAIKAKLTELNCYVDDELPDYIMVMIANKRTKAQMKDDLQLFLSAKTATFVDWLHIVLKKLKEVHVTNPEIFKKPAKRKPLEIEATEEDLKRIKKEKKDEVKALKKAKKEKTNDNEIQKSLTDDLPITANKLSEARKIIVMKENQISQNMTAENHIDEDNFDIPLLSEINASNEEELAIIQQKVKSVKSRLGLHVESDDEDCLDIKPDADDLLLNEQFKKSKESVKQTMNRKVTVESVENKNKPEETEKRALHTRITFDKEKDSLKAKYESILKKHTNTSPRKSVLDRLGKRPGDQIRNTIIKRMRNETSNKFDKDRRENKNSRSKESVLNRLGVMSKVSIPVKKITRSIEETSPEEASDDDMTSKEVPSVVKIKPRILPRRTKQANPNLLFKAVAEAQRSVSTISPKKKSKSPEICTSNDSSALFTKKYKEKIETKFLRKAKLLENEKKKLQVLLNNSVNDNKNNDFDLEKQEVSSSGINSEENVCNINQKFIVTLDGIEKAKFSQDESKSIVKIRRTPSPIIFEKPKASNIPDKLPMVQTPSNLKNKERCKYWPGCRQGDKCEFFHPTTNCKMFPNCKFEDKCLYIHPLCKFESSCTRRDCPFSHSGKNANRLQQNLQKPVSQICKFFPGCSNLNCTFYHPRLCKFGVFCKNQLECNFVHSFPTKPGNLTWRSEHR